MVDFDTLCSVDGYLAAYPGAFGGASELEIERAVEVLHTGVLEGAEPDWEDVRDAVHLVQNPSPGPRTREEIVEGARRRLARRAEKLRIAQ